MRRDEACCVHRALLQKGEPEQLHREPVGSRDTLELQHRAEKGPIFTIVLQCE